MSRLPIISGKVAVKVFTKLGYQFDHQTGSHMILRHTQPPFRRLVIPDHKTLAKGTLRSIIREAGITVDIFVSCL